MAAKPEVDQSSLNFKGKSLPSADMSGIDLRSADFSHAVLREAKFQRARLLDANFRFADLREAVFIDKEGEQDTPSTAVGLSSAALAGANLEGAKLPEELLEFPHLHNLEEASKSGSNIVFAIAAACAFCVLSSSTLTDSAVITNTASTAVIPGVGLALPVIPFLAIAPFLLLALHIYFVLMLQRYLDLMADLPAVFPDGTGSIKRMYPWLFSSLVSLRGDVRYWHRYYVGVDLEFCFAIFLAYVIIPGSIWMMWFRALCSHNIVAYTTLFALASSIVVSLYQFALGRATLIEGVGRATVSRRFYPRWMWLITGTAVCLFGIGTAITIQASVGEIKTAADYSFFETPVAQRTFVRKLIDTVGYFQAPQIDNQDVSRKPQSWTGRETKGEPELKAITGANVEYKNLHYLQGYKSFLVNARMEGADLKGAVLAFADLRGSNLNGSQAIDADLTGAKVSSIDTPSRLNFANYERAVFKDASLRGATFFHTGLKGANFEGADLSGADFTGSDVTAKQLELAKMIDDQTLVSPPLSLYSCSITDSVISVSLSDKSIGVGNGWAVWRPSASQEDREDSHWSERIKKLKKCSDSELGSFD